MTLEWPLASYEDWSETCDTLHAHTQVLGKLSAALAPREPELQHAALRLTARGWETAPLPAPDRSGALVVVLDLRTHDAVVEHRDGRTRTFPLAPDRPVGEVTREVLGAVRQLGGPIDIDLTPQEVPWTIALDEDDQHFRYEPSEVSGLFRGRHPGRARAGRIPRSVPWAVDTGQRMVGLVRLGGQSVLRAAGRPALRRLHHAQRHGRSRRSRWAGGRAMPATASPPSTATPIRPSRGSPRQRCHRRQRAGTTRSVSTSSTRPTCCRVPTRTISR